MPFVASCNIDSVVTLTNSNSLAKNVNFGVTCKPGYDAGIQSITTSGWVFPGQQHQVNILVGDMSQWYNLHCAQGTSGQVQFSISGPVAYVGVATNALVSAITGNTFTYQIADFGTINNSQAFGLLFKTDTTAQSGDTICVNATVTSAGNDNNLSNNSYQFCYNVINSYDPNMKEVYPVNVLPGYQDWFTYTIHFQNTGFAPAFNIRLADTLDSNFDLETFQVINYSHYNTVSLHNNNLSFRFPNIMLPDSTSNPEGSKGFVQYRIKPKPSLPLGTQIQNTAHIYFDYNAPIVTNTTINEFTQTASIKESKHLSSITIYPNPSTGKYFITLQENIKSNEFNIEVYNLLGELILNQKIQNQTTQIDLSQYPQGTYILKASGANQSFHQRIIKN
jgi:uncharacterized repeat protein (TIGR01451 family)